MPSKVPPSATESSSAKDDSGDELDVAEKSGEKTADEPSSSSTTPDIDKTRSLRSSFRQMKRRRAGRKISLPATINQRLKVGQQPHTPPPSPVNQSKGSDSRKGSVEKVDSPELEDVKDTLTELPVDQENSGDTEQPKFEPLEQLTIETEHKPSEDETYPLERPIDVNGLPTALRSPDRQKNSPDGAKVAFIEPVRSAKKSKRQNKISFRDMKEVKLKKSTCREDSDEERFLGKIFGKKEDPDLDKPQESERDKIERALNVLCCRRSLAEKGKLPEKHVSLRQLFKYGTRMDILLVLIGLVMAIFCGLCQSLFAIVLGSLANTFLLLDKKDPQFYRDGFKAIIMFCGLGVSVCVVSFVQFCCFNVACLRIVRKIRVNYLRSILRQNPAWFEKTICGLRLNHTGVLNTRLNDSIERIHEGIGDRFGLLVRNGAQYIAGICIAFIWCWQMAVPLVILSPIMASAMSISTRWISNTPGAYGEAEKVAEEAITGIRMVAAFNGQENEVERYKNALDKSIKRGLKKGVHSGLISGFLLGILMLLVGFAIFYGAYLYSIDVIKTPGDIFVVLLAVISGAYHLGAMSPHYVAMLKARVAAACVYRTIDRVPSIDPYSQEGQTIYDMRGKVTFRNVTFRHPSRRDVNVLEEFSFTARPGQTTALVDIGGSGKNAVSGILNRLYEYESGSVQIDGHELKELNVKWLRSVIGTVQQEPVVFSATVEENLRMGCTTLTAKRMIAACQMANAHDFIEKLPGGYQTRVGDGGIQLTSGQKQRLVIARCLARNPKILILDEVTPALDTDSERIVQDALNNACKGRSTIIITHRLSMVRNADRIVLMKNGNVVEAGTHIELLERKGVYAKLVQEAGGDESNEQNEQEELTSSSEEEESDEEGRRNHLCESEVKERIRRSYKRAFLTSGHLGDAETETLTIELKREGREFSLAHLFLDARGLWISLAIALSVCLFNALSMPLTAIIYGNLFVMFEGGRKDVLYDSFRLLVFFVILGVVVFGAVWTTTYLFNRIGEEVTAHLRLQAFRNILNQDGAYFDDPQHSPRKLVTRLSTDASNVKAAMDIRFSEVCRGLLSVCTAIIYSMFIDLPMTLACSLLFTLQGILQFMLTRKAHQNCAERVDEAGKYALEAIENVRTIQLLVCEDTILDRFNEISKHELRAELLTGPFNALKFASIHGLEQLTQAFCYSVGFFFVMTGWSSEVGVFQVVQTLYFGSISVFQAFVYFPELVKSRLAASLMFNIINQRPGTGNPDAGKKFEIEGNIEMDQVYFSYPHASTTVVLKDISLKASTDRGITLIGYSGSGKSTLISLLERRYDPNAGLIKIDGVELRSINLHRLREQIGFVEKRPRLFGGTIRDNICYGLPEADKIPMERIVEAATIANAHEFIANLPGGYDTGIGEKGTQLLRSQKQRICIARAVIRNPKILLLDEVASASNSFVEELVQEALDKARIGRTSITITHRLSSVINSDHIIIMGQGRILEQGSHAHLLSRRGRYYQLIKKHSLNAITE